MQDVNLVADQNFVAASSAQRHCLYTISSKYLHNVNPFLPHNWVTYLYEKMQVSRLCSCFNQ